MASDWTWSLDVEAGESAGLHGANCFEFFMQFGEVSGVRIHGWDASVARSVRISGSRAEGIDVRIGNADAGMEFRAASAVLTRVRGFHAGTP